MASVSYNDLQRDPATKDLFSKRITTIKGLYSSLEGSSFIAIDTEHVAASSQEDRILHQIGVVFLPALLSPPSTQLNVRPHSLQRPCLQDFYSQHSGRAITLNIALSEQDHERLVLHRGDKGTPKRRISRYGQEKIAPIETAEELIAEFFQGLPDDKPLVLLGFDMAAEWTYLASVLPSIIRFISAWADVRDIAKDIVSSVGYSVLPALSTMLPMFGYSSRELSASATKDSSRSGNADNATDDAVATCALAHALLFHDNQSKLMFYQKCNYIARPRAKRSRYQTPSQWDGFSATIRAQAPLPRIFKTGSRVAGHFFDYSPKRAGLISQDTAFLTFSTEDEIQHFIKATDGQSLPTGEVLTVQAYSQPNDIVGREMEVRKSKRQLREAKKLALRKEETQGITLED
jgi:hypothetical protein